MKHLFCLMMTLTACLPSFAVSPKEDPFEFTHNRFAFNGLLTSSDIYMLEASYHYMFNRNLGIGGGIGIWKNYFHDGYASGHGWELDDDASKPSDIYLRVSAVLKSPSLVFKSAGWGLIAEPAMLFNIPYKRVCINEIHNYTVTGYHYLSTNKGQWLTLEMRAGVYVNFGPVGFSAGYGLSNLDIYSPYRHLSYKGTSFKRFYPGKALMQGAYLSATYYF